MFCLQFILSCGCPEDGIKLGNHILTKHNNSYLLKRDGTMIENNDNYSLSYAVNGKYTDGLLIIYFDVFRIIPKIQITGPNNANLPKSPIEQSLSSSVQQQNIINRFLFTKQWLINLDSNENRMYRHTNKTSGLMDEVMNAFNILLAPYEFSRINNDYKIMFKTPNGEVDVDDLSDGLKSVFSIIGEMLFRFSIPYMNQDNVDTEKILDTEAVVLIDEIDCHLHPKWQLNIIPALRKLFPNVQFIMTTHAPFVVSSVYPDEVYKLGEIENE